MRFLVCKSVVTKIISQLARSIIYEARHTHEEIYEVRTANFDYQIEKVESKWKCSCDYQVKTGIPCSHLLRVLLLEKSRLMPYIHHHWIIKGNNSTPKTQFQRKTRRNQIK